MTVATFDELIREMCPDERTVEYGGVTTAVSFGGYCWVNDYCHGNLYVRPDLSGDRKLRSHTPFEWEEFFAKLRALEMAEQYRMAITDESLPAGIEEGARLLVNHDPFFCRQFIIHWLGRIRYNPACPNLREAMLHDLRHEVRGAAAKALGRIKDRRYTHDVVAAMRDDRNECVRYYALEALGLMKDEAALPALREMFEEGRREIYLAHLLRDKDRCLRGQETITDAIGAIKKIGGRSASQILRKAEHDADFWVRWSAGKGVEYSAIG